MFILGFFIGCLMGSLAVALFIGLVRSGHTDEEETKPICFGSNPNYQHRAENDCISCRVYEKCLHSGVYVEGGEIK